MDDAPASARAADSRDAGRRPENVAGAVIASMADTLMLKAFKHGQPLNACATALSFFLSFALVSA